MGEVVEVRGDLRRACMGAVRVNAQVLQAGTGSDRPCTSGADVILSTFGGGGHRGGPLCMRGLPWSWWFLLQRWRW